eukprot:m.7783 g.7783  ORF g.7783 m.7783 type:complete len:120 (+) comp3773_c0_seq1:60-419(+)
MASKKTSPVKGVKGDTEKVDELLRECRDTISKGIIHVEKDKWDNDETLCRAALLTVISRVETMLQNILDHRYRVVKDLRDLLATLKEYLNDQETGFNVVKNFQADYMKLQADLLEKALD